MRPIATTLITLLLASAPLSGAVAQGLPAGLRLPTGVNANSLPFDLRPNSGQGQEATAEQKTREQQAQQRADRERRSTKLGAYEDLVKGLLTDRRIDEEEGRFLEEQARALELTPAEAHEATDRLAKTYQDLFTYLLNQAQALANDGPLGEEDLKFVAQRARDRGVPPLEAKDLAVQVGEQLRKVQMYRSILETFLSDDLLDAGEEQLLETRRQELGILPEEAQEVKTLATGKRRNFAQDVLADLRRRDQSLTRMEEEVALFGQELFAAPQEAFLPSEGIPPPDTYIVGPGDTFRISLWGRLSEEYKLEVSREGLVQFPKVGEIRVGGLRYVAAIALLKGRAEAITGVSAAVSLDKMRSVQVFVVGEVARPGSVVLSPLSGTIQAVIAAGGPTQLGSLRSITHRRGDGIVNVLDLYRFLNSGDAGKSAPLQAGDVVVVPRATSLVKAVGEVRRPALYELRTGETVADLLLFAGGLTPNGDASRIQVERSRRNQARMTHDVALEDQGGFELQDGDVVRVYALSTEIANQVALYGHVQRPGTYAFRPGLRVSELVGGPANLKPDVDLAYAVVLREDEATRKQSMLPLHLGRALAEDAEQDLVLQARDEVFVFACTQFRPPQRTRITGRVRNPGIYSIVEGVRVADLLRMAGGVEPDALLSRAEILRYLPDRQRSTLYVDLGAALNGDATQNLLLEDEDQLIVHRAWTTDTEEVVLIEGEVHDYQEQWREQLRQQPRRPPFEEIQLQRNISITERLAARLRQEQQTLEKDRAAPGTPSGIVPTPTPSFHPSTTAPQQGVSGLHTFREEATSISVDRVPALAVPLTQHMTVRDAVFKAGGLTRNAYLPVAHLYRTDRATKQVTILTFHLGKALDGDPADNPILQDMDHLVVHSAFDFNPVQPVTVAGQITQPGDYPHAANMHVRDLVLAAGGLIDDAYLLEAELVRSQLLEGQQGETVTLRFSLSDAMAGVVDANLPLQPYDKVFIKKIPDWKETRKVVLEGEVRFPGTYYASKGERLSSVLLRAGGLTDEAYLRGAIFTRERAREQQQQRLDELRDRLQQAIFRVSSERIQTALSTEDIASQQQFLASQQGLLNNLAKTRATGRVIIQLKPLEELPDTEWDLTLEDGDALAVPKRPQTVAVVGEVYNPTSLLWEPTSRTVDHYLQKTGGPTVNAEAEQIYVVRADGTVVSSATASGGNWWALDELGGLELYPGDTILVPEKVVRFSFMKEIKDVSQILYQIAITAGVAVAVL